MRLNQTIEEQISDLEKQLADLKTAKEQEARKRAGLDRYDAVLSTFLAETGLTEGEVFLARSEQLVTWLKAVAKQEFQPKVFEELRALFASLPKEGGRKRAAKPTKVKAAGKSDGLSTGVYLNPVTGETIEKKRRTPKELELWVTEHGLGKVQGWKQAS